MELNTERADVHDTRGLRKAMPPDVVLRVLPRRQSAKAPLRSFFFYFALFASSSVGMVVAVMLGNRPDCSQRLLEKRPPLAVRRHPSD